MAHITQTVLTDCRNWMLDCGAKPSQVREASDRTIMQEINRHYVGGMEQFLLDGDYPQEAWVEPLVVLDPFGGVRAR